MPPSTRLCRWFLRISALTMVVVTFVLPAQTRFECPVERQGDNPLDYQQRSDNLCEGFYDRERSQSPIELLGFTTQRNLAPDQGSPLQISAAASVQGVIKLTSLFNRPEELYRMDGRFTSEHPLIWPISDTFAKSGIDLKDANFLAWQETPEKVYIPVSVNAQGTFAAQQAKVTLRTAMDFAPLSFRLIQANQVGPWQHMETVYAWDIVELPVPLNQQGKLEVKGRNANQQWSNSVYLAFDTGAGIE